MRAFTEAVLTILKDPLARKNSQSTIVKIGKLPKTSSHLFKGVIRPTHGTNRRF